MISTSFMKMDVAKTKNNGSLVHTAQQRTLSLLVHVSVVHGNSTFLEKDNNVMFLKESRIFTAHFR